LKGPPWQTQQSPIILPPIAAASLSPQAHLGLQRVSSAPGPYVGLFFGSSIDGVTDGFTRVQSNVSTKLASPNMEAISPNFPQPESGRVSRTPSDDFTRTASDSSVQSRGSNSNKSAFSRTPSAGLGFTRTASNSSNKSNESLSQAERVRKLGLLIYMRS
jgi:hypothetical protein